MQSLGVSSSFLKAFIQEHLTSKIPVESTEDLYLLNPEKVMALPKSGHADAKSRQSEKKGPVYVEEPIHMDMFQVCENVIKPLTQSKQTRFVEMHHGKVSFTILVSFLKKKVILGIRH